MKSLPLFTALIIAATIITGPAVALDLKAPPLTPLAQDGIHDPAVGSIHTLQDPKESMKKCPKDRPGQVNWVEA